MSSDIRRVLSSLFGDDMKCLGIYQASSSVTYADKYTVDSSISSLVVFFLAFDNPNGNKPYLKQDISVHSIDLSTDFNSSGIVYTASTRVIYFTYNSSSHYSVYDVVFEGKVDSDALTKTS